MPIDGAGRDKIDWSRAVNTLDASKEAGVGDQGEQGQKRNGFQRFFTFQAVTIVVLIAFAAWLVFFIWAVMHQPQASGYCGEYGCTIDWTRR